MRYIEVQPRDCAVCKVRLERVREYPDHCSTECWKIAEDRAEKAGAWRWAQAWLAEQGGE